MSGEDPAGQGIDGDLGLLSELYVDDVGLVHLYLGGYDGHVGEGHDGATGRVLDAHDHGLALTHREIGNHAVIRGGVIGLAEHVRGTAHLRAVLLDVAFA